MMTMTMLTTMRSRKTTRLIHTMTERASCSHYARSSRLAKYYVEPVHMKKLLRVYRQLSDRITRKVNLTEFERLEDENKAFALLEMHSRIMEKDMECGLERRGGTVVVDNLVLTAYNRTARPICDAVIVANAWRDGASTKDVVTRALLTRRPERSYFIRRPLHPHHSHRHRSSARLSRTNRHWKAPCC